MFPAFCVWRERVTFLLITPYQMHRAANPPHFPSLLYKGFAAKNKWFQAIFSSDFKGLGVREIQKITTRNLHQKIDSTNTNHSKSPVLNCQITQKNTQITCEKNNKWLQKPSIYGALRYFLYIKSLNHLKNIYNPYYAFGKMPRFYRPIYLYIQGVSLKFWVIEGFGGCRSIDGWNIFLCQGNMFKTQEYNSRSFPCCWKYRLRQGSVNRR